MKVHTLLNTMVAEYAQEHGLLDEWESPRRKLKKAASQSDRLMRFQAHVQRIKNNRAQVVYQYGHQVPRNHGDAMRIDSINGDNNNKWAESEKWEAQQLLEYKAFLDLRHHSTNGEHIRRLCDEGYKTYMQLNMMNVTRAG